MSWWTHNTYPGDETDQKIRAAAKSLVSNKTAKAVAIVVIDNDGKARGQVAMTGTGFGDTAEKRALERQLAERLNEYQDELL